MKILLVGGAVRDLLLGRRVRDMDFLVLDGDEQEFVRAFPEAQKVGRHFPVFLYQGGEFSFPRGEGIDQDLSARDLTINAMALDEEGNLFAHPKALEDLAERRLRPASDTSLDEDPLRVVRSARIWAELPEFSPSAELVEAMKRAGSKERLAKIPRERIASECLKGFQAKRPGNFLRLLYRAKTLSPWFEEFGRSDEIPAGPRPHHSESVLEHVCSVMDALARHSLRVWMGMCHDLGKTATDPQLLPHHYGHEVRGADMAEALGNRLGLPNRFITAGRIAAGRHMTGGQYPKLRPGTRVDLLSELAARELMEEFFAVVRADHGEDFLDAAKRDLETIQSVHLPPEDRDLGPASGEKLRQMRAQALGREGRKV
ncbi:MAG: tRNA nucleotidyltransferase [Desulfovibrionales bacterium]